MIRFERALVRDLVDAPSPPPVELLVRRARRRRARFWASGIAALVAIAGGVAVIVRSPHGPPRVAVRPSVVEASPSDVVMFDDNGGVSAVDFVARTVTHLPLVGWRSGDQPFLSIRVGNDVVAGWGDVVATPLSGGPSHRLGIGVVVPASEPGAVWLTSYGDVQTATERLVDMRGNVVLQGPVPRDAGGAPYTALTGAPGGLVLQTENGLAIWDARTGRITRRLGRGPGVTAVPMSGTMLAWCDHCDRALEITDVVTGVTRSVPVSLGGAFLRMDRYFAFSPDGTYLAVPAQPDGAAPVGATTKIVVVDVATGKISGEIDAHARYATVAWSPDGERIYVAAAEGGSGGRILLYDRITSTTRDVGPVPDLSGSFSAVITARDAARFPKTTAGTGADCPGPIGTAAATKGCSYPFVAP